MSAELPAWTTMRVVLVRTGCPMEYYKVSLTFDQIVEANSLDEAEDIAVERFYTERRLLGGLRPPDEIVSEVIE